MRTQFESIQQKCKFYSTLQFSVYVWKALSSQAQITLKFKHPIILENLHKRLWGGDVWDEEELSFGFNRYNFFCLGISPRIPFWIFSCITGRWWGLDNSECAPDWWKTITKSNLLSSRAASTPPVALMESRATTIASCHRKTGKERNKRKFQFQTKMLCIKIIFHMRIRRCFSISLYAFGFWHEFTEPPSGAFFIGSKNLEFATRSCYVSSHQKFIPSTPQQCVYFLSKNPLSLSRPLTTLIHTPNMWNCENKFPRWRDFKSLILHSEGKVFSAPPQHAAATSSSYR